MGLSDDADSALLLQLDLQGKDCMWGTLAFRALVDGLESAGASEPRGTDRPEHEIRLTARRADFLTLPTSGDQVSIENDPFPIARLQVIPGAVHFAIICRQPPA